VGPKSNASQPWIPLEERDADYEEGARHKRVGHKRVGLTSLGVLIVVVALSAFFFLTNSSTASRTIFIFSDGSFFACLCFILSAI
jgi:hypothetical protein